MNTQQKTYYAVGHNLVGYLPESDVWITDDWDSAKGALIEDMLFAADGCEEDEAEQLINEAEDLNLSNGPEWGTIIGYTSWWVNLTDEAPEEDNE